MKTSEGLLPSGSTLLKPLADHRLAGLIRPSDRVESIRWPERLVSLAIILVVMLPYCRRLACPSLYADDVVRVSFERSMPLAHRLVQPFNEHVAPLFEVVSTMAWSLCDGHLGRAPWMFTLASVLPLPIALGLLLGIVRRETGSRYAALGAVLLAGLIPLHAEVVGWYSASSFTWSLASALLAYQSAAIGGSRRLACAMLASLAAPAFSAIGLLAGPMAAARLVVSKSWWRALVPMLGTVAFLGWIFLIHHHEAVSHGLRPHVGRAGLEATIRAPVGSLLAGAIGKPDTAPRVLLASDVVFFLAAVAVVFVCFWKSQETTTRGLLLAGLVMIVGGYALTLGVRAHSGGQHVLATQRYQLFPIFGLALALSPGLGRLDALCRLKHGSIRTGLTTAIAALMLLAIHWQRFSSYARFYRFPEQAATLEALEKIERLALRERWPREQVLAALPSVRLRWFDHPSLSVWMLLGPLPGGTSVSATDVRASLERELDVTEREAIFGGMGATDELITFEGEPADELARGLLVGSVGIEFLSDGTAWLRRNVAYLDFDWPQLERPGDASPIERMLLVPVTMLDQNASPVTVELLWTKRQQGWSPARSIRLRIGALSDQRSKVLALPCARMPHWPTDRPLRLRLVLRADHPARLRIDPPRLLAAPNLPD